MAGRKTLYGTQSFRLRPQDQVRLRAFAASRGESVSTVLRRMVGWATHIPDVDRAMGVAAVTAAMSGPAPRGLFRLGEDSRIRHLDEGSILEGAETKGSA